MATTPKEQAKTGPVNAHKAAVDGAVKSITDALNGEHFHVLLFSTSPADVGSWVGVQPGDNLIVEHEKHDEIVSHLSDFTSLVCKYYIGETLDPAKIKDVFADQTKLTTFTKTGSSQTHTQLTEDIFLSNDDHGLREHVIEEIEERMQRLAEDMKLWGFEDYYSSIIDKKEKLAADRVKIKLAIQSAIKVINDSAAENQQKINEIGSDDEEEEGKASTASPPPPSHQEGGAGHVKVEGQPDSKGFEWTFPVVQVNESESHYVLPTSPEAHHVRIDQGQKIVVKRPGGLERETVTDQVISFAKDTGLDDMIKKLLADHGGEDKWYPRVSQEDEGWSTNEAPPDSHKEGGAAHQKIEEQPDEKGVQWTFPVVMVNEDESRYVLPDKDQAHHWRIDKGEKIRVKRPGGAEQEHEAPEHISLATKELDPAAFIKAILEHGGEERWYPAVPGEESGGESSQTGEGSTPQDSAPEAPEAPPMSPEETSTSDKAQTVKASQAKITAGLQEMHENGRQLRQKVAMAMRTARPSIPAPEIQAADRDVRSLADGIAAAQRDPQVDLIRGFGAQIELVTSAVSAKSVNVDELDKLQTIYQQVLSDLDEFESHVEEFRTMAQEVAAQPSNPSTEEGLGDLLMKGIEGIADFALNFVRIR
jgi:hypothetical protein